MKRTSPKTSKGLHPSAPGKSLLVSNRTSVYQIFSNVREAWIKAKYVDKLFIKKLPELAESSQRTSRTSLMDVRKWSVRKVRRRPKSCDNSKRSKNKTLPKTPEEASKEPVKDNEVLLFGSDLDKQPVEGAIEFSSDQESTGGEDDEEPLGKSSWGWREEG